MTILSWRPATRQDRAALQAFECTQAPTQQQQPPWEREHPHPWELEVQSWLRCQKPPGIGRGGEMWVGTDDADGLAAVLAFEVDAAATDVFVMAAAVATRHRGHGGGVADEIFAVLFDEMTARAVAANTAETLFSAHIHQSNRNSQSLARRNDMRQTAEMGDYQLWQATLEHPRDLLRLA